MKGLKDKEKEEEEEEEEEDLKDPPENEGTTNTSRDDEPTPPPRASTEVNGAPLLRPTAILRLLLESCSTSFHKSCLILEKKGGLASIFASRINHQSTTPAPWHLSQLTFTWSPKQTTTTTSPWYLNR
ncbi:unnamed protein product [Vicia faba]|uniref:Uncharacterized protein n=1 Tax=Vicia faba TaxID=3906 RepID=A0AAV1B8T7_VICFA|nr:unnamed protein product [Vicia faba]